MERIFIYKDKVTKLILRVDLHEKQKKLDNAEILKAISEFNSKAQDRYVEMLEIDSNIYEIILFLLDKKEYKQAATIEDIIERISNIESDVHDFLHEIESIGLECKKLAEKNRR